MSELTPVEVRRVAHLARLKLREDEIERLTGELGRVLDYVHRLDQVDTAGVEPLAHVAELTNVLRADEPKASLSREDALGNAPLSDGRYFLVPAILTDS
jgi:aspartyl-tRNA(Asn)/glutamyl-tRNA(Gln) amidotransferase subunit C